MSALNEPLCLSVLSLLQSKHHRATKPLLLQWASWPGTRAGGPISRAVFSSALYRLTQASRGAKEKVAANLIQYTKVRGHGGREQ